MTQNELVKTLTEIKMQVKSIDGLLNTIDVINKQSTDLKTKKNIQVVIEDIHKSVQFLRHYMMFQEGRLFQEGIEQKWEKIIDE